MNDNCDDKVYKLDMRRYVNINVTIKGGLVKVEGRVEGGRQWQRMSGSEFT